VQLLALVPLIIAYEVAKYALVIVAVCVAGIIILRRGIPRAPTKEDARE
jgi:hypothetical protein